MYAVTSWWEAKRWPGQNWDELRQVIAVALLTRRPTHPAEVFLLARSAVIDHLRATGPITRAGKYRAEPFTDEPLDEWLARMDRDHTPDHADTIADDDELRWRRAFVADVQATLTPRQAAILAGYLAGENGNTTAARLNTTRGTIDATMHQIKAKLRRHVQETQHGQDV